MSRCKACSHPQRDKIDQKLAAGQSPAVVARWIGACAKRWPSNPTIGKVTLIKHRKEHLSLPTQAEECRKPIPSSREERRQYLEDSAFTLVGESYNADLKDRAHILTMASKILDATKDSCFCNRPLEHPEVIRALDAYDAKIKGILESLCNDCQIKIG